MSFSGLPGSASHITLEKKGKWVMTQIRAAVCHAFGTPLVVETLDLAPPSAGEVEVTLGACAICHSDITYAEGSWGGALPAVYGHEAAGTVSAVGEGVRGVALGDSVVVTLIRSCGTCASCAGGTPTQCETPYDGDAGPIKTADGGTLHQAVHDVAGRLDHREDKSAPRDDQYSPVHTVTLRPDGFLAGLWPEHAVEVNSLHVGASRSIGEPCRDSRTDR